jgi:peptidoglycan hydrolase CwlO-like protein
MNKKLFLASALSIAILLTGTSFVSAASNSKIKQDQSEDTLITKFNSTEEQRKEAIANYEDQIKDLQKQMDQIRFDYTIENSEKTKMVEDMEKQIEGLRLEIHNLE